MSEEIPPRKDVIVKTVEDELKESYLRYALSVIISRALPDVRDGLKPSQRRILYAMLLLRLSPGGKHRKCAKISGDTSGDYHPHGEQVIYPTLARLAQSWIMRYRLVDGQGNFGSVDGDPPAAMRYTEARLTHASVQLMEDMEKNTVDFVPNYDDTRKEPVVFPSRFPNLVCNGSSGIAVGMATNIPPHNFKEVAGALQVLLTNPYATVEEVMHHLPGPDFPTGGVICGRRGILDAYHTGRGKVILRGRYHFEEGKNDRQTIVFTEIPYNVNKSRLVESIAQLINDKQVTAIADLRDESDKDGLRLVIELKRGELPEVVVNQLFKFTDLQVTFGCNLLVLDHGSPKVMGICGLLTAWIAHRIQVIRRRSAYELERAQDRSHVVEGYLKALDILDAVIQTIKESQNREVAKNNLQSIYAFTERQAQAILELRLYQITGMERESLEIEFQQLKELIARLQAILASEQRVKALIAEDLQAMLKVHSSERQTEISDDEAHLIDTEDLIADDPIIVTISSDDYIKRMSIDTFRQQRRGGQGVTGIHMKKEDDSVRAVYVTTNHNFMLIFTNFGRCHWVKAWRLPDSGRRSKGKPIVQLLEGLQEHEQHTAAVCVRQFNAQQSVFFCTRKGIIKRTLLDAFSNPRRTGIQAISIDEDDQLITAGLVQSEQQIMLFTQDGMAVRFDATQVRCMGRTARGVRAVRLKSATDVVVGCEVVSDDDVILVVCSNGYGKRTRVSEYRQTSRGGLGVRSIVTSARNGTVVAALKVSDTDSVLLMTSSGQTIRIPGVQIRIMGRSTQGVRLTNVKEGDKVVAVQLIQSVNDQI